jgi:hypothetical protein
MSKRRKLTTACPPSFYRMPVFFHTDSCNHGHDHSHTSDQAKQEVLQALAMVKDEQGKTLEQLNMLHSLDVQEGTGVVLVKLNLTGDYRKIK